MFVTEEILYSIKAVLATPNVTILSASSVQMLVHCVVKYSRPPDLKSSSNVSLPFAWITGPVTDPSLDDIMIIVGWKGS